MPSRSLIVAGRTWQVYPSGFVTPMGADEFGLIFVSGSGESAEMRVTRYSPRGSVSREASLAEMSDAELRELMSYSQPGTRSPEVGYRS